ncbi:MAG: alkane 1-monooxygenase [Paracoccaceae bacterium]
MRRALFGFAIVTLLPVPLLVIGGFAGGVWIAAALVYLSALAMALDRIVTLTAAPVDPGAEFAAADILSAVLAVTHFALMVLAVAAVSGVTGLVWWERVLAFFAFGLFFGQVSNSNAHELIHRARPWLRRLGVWVFITHLFGHHASAHPKVHHRHVGSDGDPNSARLGESFYHFAPRAWIGSFAKGLRAEIENPAQQRWHEHPYALYVAGGLGCCLLALIIGGWEGLAAYLGLAGYATAQLLLSDYVQHYGLRRRVMPGGRLEPVGPQHSWNAPQWFTGRLMLNAPRHSDHHAHPARPYPALAMPGPNEAPTLPRSLPVMGMVALVPRRWRALMDPAVEDWALRQLAAE